MSLSFKSAEPSDADSLLAMMRELYAHDRIPFDEGEARAALELLVSEPSFGRVLLITLGGETAGYVVLTFGFSIEFRGRDAFVDELFVKEEFRGRGLGKSAIQFAEGVCRENGVRALHLEVERENTGAQVVYRKAGFVDHDRYLLTKWL